jgi:hypothetical protein
MNNGMVPLLFDANYDVKRADGSFPEGLSAAGLGRQRFVSGRER